VVRHDQDERLVAHQIAGGQRRQPVLLPVARVVDGAHRDPPPAPDLFGVALDRLPLVTGHEDHLGEPGIHGDGDGSFQQGETAEAGQRLDRVPGPQP
jgi:hypothetical protein